MFPILIYGIVHEYEESSQETTERPQQYEEREIMKFVGVLIILAELNHTSIHYGYNLSLTETAKDVQNEGTNA